MTSNTLPHSLVTLQGNLLQVKKPQPEGRHFGGGKRGVCSQKITPQSRKRLTQKMLCLDWRVLRELFKIRFLTLTTPTQYWHDLELVYHALEKIKYLLFKNGASGCIVRKEYGEKHGMLHYHILVIIPKDCPGWFPELPTDGEPGEITKAWAAALNYEGRVRVSSEIPKSWDKVQYYVTKYCAKIAFNDIETGSDAPLCERSECEGESEALSMSHNAEKKPNLHNGRRLWYVWGKKSLPWAWRFSYDFDESAEKVVYKIRRIFRKMQKIRVKRSLMRRALKNLVFGDDIERKIQDSEVERVFFSVVPPDKWRHIYKDVKDNHVLKYLRRGGHGGFTLWLNENDVAVIESEISKYYAEVETWET